MITLHDICPEPPIFVVNLPRCYVRKNRMVNRLNNANLLNRATFVDAVDKTCEEVTRVNTGHITDPRYDPDLLRRETACLLSHLKALRTFVDTSEAKGALILEDDAVLYPNFSTELTKVLQKCPVNIPVVMLCHYITDPRDIYRQQPGLYNITENTFCTAAYYISREYAEKMLQKYEHKTLIEMGYPGPERITSEAITRFSKGWFTHNPCLVIQECLETNIQSGSQLDNMRNYYRQWMTAFVEAEREAGNEDVLTVWRDQFKIT